MLRSLQTLLIPLVALTFTTAAFGDRGPVSSATTSGTVAGAAGGRTVLGVGQSCTGKERITRTRRNIRGKHCVNGTVVGVYHSYPLRLPQRWKGPVKGVPRGFTVHYDEGGSWNKIRNRESVATFASDGAYIFISMMTCPKCRGLNGWTFVAHLPSLTPSARKALVRDLGLPLQTKLQSTKALTKALVKHRP